MHGGACWQAGTVASSVRPTRVVGAVVGHFVPTEYLSSEVGTIAYSECTDLRDLNFTRYLIDHTLSQSVRNRRSPSGSTTRPCEARRLFTLVTSSPHRPVAHDVVSTQDNLGVYLGT